MNLGVSLTPTFRASNIQSADNTILYAGGNLYIGSAANTTRHNQETTESKVGLNIAIVGSTLDAGNNLNIKAGNNIEFTAAKLGSGADTNLTAEEGQVRFLTQKNINVVSHTFDNEDLVYEVHKGDGHKDESLVYAQIKTGDKLNINAANKTYGSQFYCHKIKNSDVSE